MALLRIDDYDKADSGSGSSNSLLYNLNIGGDYGSKAKQVPDEKGKPRTMFYEDGWFLAKATQAVLVSAHYKRGENKTPYLCAKSFESGEGRITCPMCEDQYENRENSTYQARSQFLHIPFLATRRQSEPQIAGKNKIVPIYMFKMNVTSYREDYKANLLRFLEANEKGRIHKSPYRIYAPKRKEKEVQKYFFKPLKEKPSHEITVDHPMIDDWLDEKGNWIWDKDYAEMLSALCIVRYSRYVKPKSGEPLAYDGEYEAALELYNGYKEHFGEPRIPMTDEEYAKYTESDDEDDDD